MLRGILRRFFDDLDFREFPRNSAGEFYVSRFTRRLFLRSLLGLSLISFLPFRIREGKADSVPSSGTGRTGSISGHFMGEELFYEVGVWIFKRAALGKLSFKETEKKGFMMAVLEAETLGVLGWVARYRVDTYRAVMEEMDGGKRFRAVSFEEDVKIGNKLRRKTHLFDYQRRKWTQIKRKKDGTPERTEVDIPPGMVYDDFLTASYNFRYGVYGEITRGKKFTVATFPRKGSSSYEVIVAPKEEEEKRRKDQKKKEGKEFYVKLFLDPEITHSNKGLIEGWLSKELYPLEGTVKDVILFGDVKGTLVKKTESRQV
jgi:hypothetical protein